jgi:hypothetical protein
VIEHQYISKHLYRLTEYYEAVGSYSTLAQNQAPVTGGRVSNPPLLHDYFFVSSNPNENPSQTKFMTISKNIFLNNKTNIIYGISLAFLFFLKWLELRFIIFDHL